jgi:hypothetical protein
LTLWGEAVEAGSPESPEVAMACVLGDALAAVRAVLAEGHALPSDLGGTARTSQLTEAALARIRASPR